MPQANTAYDIMGGLEVTQSTTTAAYDTVTVSSGVYRNRTVGVTTYANSAYVSVVGASVTGTGSSSTPLALAATGYKRIDLVVYDTSSSTFKVITGTAVLAAATAITPTIASATQFPLATIAVSDLAISRRIDVRDTADYLPVRAFNRSQNVRIGKQVVRSVNNVYVDLNDPVSAKELAYHSSIGAIYVTGSITSANSDLQVNTGLKPGLGSFASSNQPLTASAGEIRNADNQVLYPVASASALPTASVTATSSTSTAWTYTATNNFVVGQNVTITGITGTTTYNTTGLITARTNTSFTIAGTGSPASTSSQSGTASIAIPVAGTSNLRNDLMYLDISDPNVPFYGLLNGTAAAGTTGLAGIRFADLTKDQIPVGVVIAPASGTSFSIVDVRPVY